MKMIKQSFRINSQKAVFLPISAVVALGILTFLFLLVGYTGRVKVAQSELRAKLDIACGDVALQETYAGREEKFAARVKELMIPGALRYSTLTVANLIMPTMPADGNFDFPPADLATQGGDGPRNIDCNGIDCRIYSSIQAFAEQYPPRLWNNLRNAGNTVGCEFKANVKADFLSPYFRSKLNPESFDLYMKSVWWSPIRGPIPSYVGNDGKDISPGLTIAIGTEMFTTSWDERFRFKSDLARYNPLTRHNRFFNTNDSVSTTKGAPGPTTPEIRPIPTPSAVKPFSAVSGNFPNRDTSFLSNLSINNAATWVDPPSDRDGLLTACMNPVILARNTLLSVIVELAGRHGQLRNMTEILHMNPVHRDPKFYSATGYTPNYPSKIVGFGQDLMKKQYQLPYVFFHSGYSTNPLINTNIDPAYNWYESLGYTSYPSLGGFINPFQSTTTGTDWERQANDDRAKIHALIASQLRLCQNLYGPDISGLQKDIPRSSDFQGFLNEDDTYEAPIYDTYRSMAYQGEWTSNRPREHNVGTWDQKCQYPDSPCGMNEAADEPMSAAQLLSSLGSTQLCPYNYNIHGTTSVALNQLIDSADGNNNNIPSFSTGSPCPLTYPPSYEGGTLPASLSSVGSSDDRPLELQPDLLGTLRYIRKQMPAIKPPGLFPLKSNSANLDADDVPFADEPAALEPTVNTNSSILLLIHQPMTQDLITAIRDEVKGLVKGEDPATDAGSYDLRPITLIYMPTTFQDHERVVDLRAAFTVVEESESLTEDDRVFYSSDGRGYRAPVVIYNISPYDKYWGKPCSGIDETDQSEVDIDSNGNTSSADGSHNKTQAKVFQDYWTCLMTDEGANVVNMAERIFHDRILRKELKF